MNSKTILTDEISQAISSIPSLVWIFIAAAVLLSVFSRPIANAFLPDFKAKPLLNNSEKRLFKMLQPLVPNDFLLLAQVSYGEFLGCKNHRKYWTINAKRADIVICDANFNVVAVIEYQGRGHHGTSQNSRNGANQRDSIKKKALAEAGIAMIEIFPKFNKDIVRQSLEAVINPPEKIEKTAYGAKYRQ